MENEIESWHNVLRWCLGIGCLIKIPLSRYLHSLLIFRSLRLAAWINEYSNVPCITVQRCARVVDSVGSFYVHTTWRDTSH